MLLLGILLLEFNLQYKYIYYSLSQIDKKEPKHHRLQNIYLCEQYEGCFSYYQEGFISGARLLLLLAMVALRCVPDSCFLCKTQKNALRAKSKCKHWTHCQVKHQPPLISYCWCPSSRILAPFSLEQPRKSSEHSVWSSWGSYLV